MLKCTKRQLLRVPQLGQAKRISTTSIIKLTSRLLLYLPRLNILKG
jgi:hypothetical protein